MSTDDYRYRNGGPAFPVPAEANLNDQEGMSLRDYFAIHILQGVLSHTGATVDIDGDHIGQKRAATAYAIADAMLAERAKGETV